MNINKNQKKSKKYPWKKLSLTCSLFFLYFVFAGQRADTLKQVEKSTYPVFYANKCHDNFRILLTSSIKKAQKNILLKSFTLTEEYVCRALVKKSREGIPIKIKCHSNKHSDEIIKKAPRIKVEPKLRTAGYMHQKILIIDSDLVWLGSANISKESLISDDNLMVGVRNKDLATIFQKNCSGECIIKNQSIKVWLLPQDSASCLKEIIDVLNSATKSIKMAMFFFTHPDLFSALVKAHQRGVFVEVIVDKRGSHFIDNSVCPNQFYLSSQSPCIHHKFAWIDDRILIFGSANWTKNGFDMNEEDVIIINNLTHTQNKKLHLIWKDLSYTKKLLPSLKPETILLKQKKSGSSFAVAK
ncbi:phospholipase D-like domain-containing protein [Candidatus Clavichlamydia salmonicola]|uniref:phospholipase D-like domain-containing protein n=1 Tax=Candidatus Clavichlamydia salmonicola TaxID=469812 RepID=UPI001890D533|nr:phospholipase D-like domain-containing protein [Candidatus Clavichlamydia salmonicola]